MQMQGAVVGLNISKNQLSDYECLPCILAKTKRMSYKTKPERAKVPLERLSLDLAQMEEPAIDGSIYTLVIVDEATRFKWGFLLETKDQAKIHIAALVLLLNNQFEHRGSA
jgi:hypothetical protein